MQISKKRAKAMIVGIWVIALSMKFFKAIILFSGFDSFRIFRHNFSMGNVLSTCTAFS